MPLPPSHYLPQVAPEAAVWQRQAVVAWLLMGAFGLALTALIIGAPLAQAGGYERLARTIYRGFSPFCHQLSGRSFHLHEHPFAVCARCTGLYFGLAAGVLAYPLLRSLRRFDTPARGWLILALIPVGADFLLGWTGIWANTHWSRAATGGWLGAVIALYLVPGLLDLRFHWRDFLKSSATAAKPLATVNDDARWAAAPSDYSAPARRVKI